MLNASAAIIASVSPMMATGTKPKTSTAFSI